MSSFVTSIWYPLLVVLISLLVGWLVDLLLGAWLARDEQSRRWRWARALAESLHGVIEVWALLAGVWLFTRLVFPPFTSLIPATWSNTGLVALFILSCTVFASRLSARLVRVTMAREDVLLPSSTIFVNLARISVWAIGLTMLLSTFGIKVSALVAALGVVGLAVSLGLQDTLANLFSGLQIVLGRIVEPGEQVRLSTGEEGAVMDVTWRQTTIRNATGDLVIVPNSIIGRGLLTNLSKPTPERTAQITFTVAYGSDLGEVEALAREAAEAVIASDVGAVSGAEPTVRLRGFVDGGISVLVGLRVSSPDVVPRMRGALVRELHTRLASAGIEMGAAAAETPPKSAPPPAPGLLKPPAR
jgi:small-conductance mechanosensitive channel